MALLGQAKHAGDTNQGLYPYFKNGTLGLEPHTLLALMPPQPHRILAFCDCRPWPALGGQSWGTAVKALCRVLLDSLYPTLLPEMSGGGSQGSTRNQAGSEEKDGVRTGPQIRTGAMQVKRRRQRVAMLTC